MNNLAHRYLELGERHLQPAPEIDLPKDALEDMQLMSFDDGYQAGWEDAITAQKVTAEKDAEGISQNFQDLAFSHREAYEKLRISMRPLLLQIVNKLLPESARQLVGLHLIEKLSQIMENYAETAIEIAASPENMEQLNSVLENLITLPFKIVSEPNLTAGQVYLRIGQCEEEINIDAVINGIADAIEAYYNQTSEETSNV